MEERQYGQRQPGPRSGEKTSPDSLVRPDGEHGKLRVQRNGHRAPRLRPRVARDVPGVDLLPLLHPPRRVDVVDARPVPLHRRDRADALRRPPAVRKLSNLCPQEGRFRSVVRC